MATATAATTSSKNPFRDPEQQRASTPEHATTSTSTPPPAVSSSSPPGSNNRDPLGLTEEEPPAYTPSPDFRQGEETLELGPRRPFQPPPGPPNRTQLNASAQTPLGHRPTQSIPPSRSSPSLWRQLTGQIASELFGPSSYSGSSTRYQGSPGWSAYPGTRQQHHQDQQLQTNYTGGSSTSDGIPPLPQRSASVRDPAPPSTTTTAADAPMSDFARDFYAAGAQQGSQSSPSLPSSQFSPPPGPPPSTGPASPTSPSTTTRNDGKPTSTPTPGHPLMRDGKVLVYPKGYTCEKCQNIGFKHADPSHPCRKCWQKYAKPFQGPLAYAFDSESSASSPLAGSTLQRPLPDFRPPQRQVHTAPQQPPSLPPRPPVPQFAPMGLPGMPGGFGNAPGPLNVRTLSPWSLGVQPSNGVVYSAGDPRLGGRLCWNCDGRGTISLFLFDESTCHVCNGLGRVFS